MININDSIKTVDEVLKMKNELEKMGLINFPKNLDFRKVYIELLNWFGDFGKAENEFNSCAKFFNAPPKELLKKCMAERYTINILIVMEVLDYCQKHKLIDECSYGNMTEVYSTVFCRIAREIFEKHETLKYSDFFELSDFLYKDYLRYCKISEYFKSQNIYFPNNDGIIAAIITNRMQMNHDNFETFFRKYEEILQKYTISNIVNPTYALPIDVKSRYGYVPAAYEALCQPTVGFWVYNSQTNMNESIFVNYSNLISKYPNIFRLVMNNINLVMARREIYEEILEKMPIIGTQFANTEPIKLEFLGFSKSMTKYILGCIYNSQIFLIVRDLDTNGFGVRILCDKEEIIKPEIDKYLMM